jgi:SH3-like domain-containing protein
MYRRGRMTLIATGCAAILGAMLLIPSGEQVAVADAPAPALGGTSQETIAAIDAMLGISEVEPAAPEPAVVTTPTITEADRNLMTAALNTTELSKPATDLEGAPLVDPDLRSDFIGASAVNLRAGPSTSTAPITVLQPGQPVQTGQSDGGWVEVTLPDGTTGWVYSRYLASTAPAKTATASNDEDKPARAAKSDSKAAKAVIKGKGKNGQLEGRTARIDAALVARSKPNGNAARVFRTSPGERVKILDVRGNWLRILTADGSSGWIERAG